MKIELSLIGSLAAFIIFAIPNIVVAHCDTLAGPVVKDAISALEKSDVTPVLKWVKNENEREITEAFNKTIAVRKQNKEAKELADMYFFETLVRIHRSGEGAPYTGLKPEEAIEPITLESDKALESGSADKLIKNITDMIAKGIRERFEQAKGTRKHAEHSIAAGREFVETYVDFTHYVERLYTDALMSSAHHAETKGMKQEGHHH